MAIPNDPKPTGPPSGGARPPAPGAGPARGGAPIDDFKRHLLVRVGAPPFTLKPGTSVIIGRAAEADLSVPSNRVSRRHSEIFWQDERPWIKDLGSQNGTLVNGKRVQEHELADNDELSVGPFLCTYRHMTGAGSASRASAAQDNNALTQPMLADAMAGRLDLVNLFELLQTLEFNQKTGTLEVFGTDGHDGQIVVQGGSPTFARTSSHQGEEAIFDIALAKDGQFSFSPAVDDTLERNVNRPITSLLLEAGRRMDEQAGAGQG